MEYLGAHWRKKSSLVAREVVAVFLGTHTPLLDEKNRVILPAKFREALASGLVMSLVYMS